MTFTDRWLAVTACPFVLIHTSLWCLCEKIWFVKFLTDHTFIQNALSWVCCLLHYCLQSWQMHYWNFQKATWHIYTVWSSHQPPCVFIRRRILLLHGGHMRAPITTTSDQLLKLHWLVACLEFYPFSPCMCCLKQTGWVEAVWIHFLFSIDVKVAVVISF